MTNTLAINMICENSSVHIVISIVVQLCRPGRYVFIQYTVILILPKIGMIGMIWQWLWIRQSLQNKESCLTCSCEPFHQCVSQLARSNESNTHPVRWCGFFGLENPDRKWQTVIHTSGSNTPHLSIQDDFQFSSDLGCWIDSLLILWGLSLKMKSTERGFGNDVI